MKKLSDVCDLITDGTHQTPIYCESGGYPFLSSKDVVGEKINWNNLKYIPYSLHKDLYKRLQPQINDILLAKNGTTGIAAIVDREEVFDIYVSLALLRPNKSIYPKYLLYVINSPTTKRQFKAGLKGIGVPNLHLNVIRNTKIIVPSYEKQIFISKIFDNIIQLIENRQQQLTLLDELIKSRFIEMFDDLRNYKMESLDTCTNFIDYRGKTPELDFNGTIRMINAKSVGKGFFKDVDEYISEQTYNEWMTRGFPQAGDVLFVTEGHTFGNVCRIPNTIQKFAMGQRVITIQGQKNVLDNCYLSEYMQTVRFNIDINTYKTGSSAQGIRSKELKTINIPIPPIELQNKFADFVEQVERTKSTIKKSLEELNLLKDSLMQKYFG